MQLKSTKLLTDLTLSVKGAASFLIPLKNTLNQINISTGKLLYFILYWFFFTAWLICSQDLFWFSKLYFKTKHEVITCGWLAK